MTILDPTEATGEPGDPSALHRLIRADQLAGVQRSLSISVPVNIFLGVATFAVAAQSGAMWIAGLWLGAASAINVARLAETRAVARRRRPQSEINVERRLRIATILAALSGLIWACTPFLSGAPQDSSTVFNLIVGAGITGGSVAMGFAHARISLCFITPILLSQMGWLASEATLQSAFLASTVLVYLLALARSAIQTEKAFLKTARLKHEARRLASSLQLSHAQTLAVAQEMSERARRDPLTNLLNRAGFVHDLEQCATGTDRVFCVMMLDLDGFKSINDAFGHTVGDEILIETGRIIRRQLPAGSHVARLGGDEFAVAFDVSECDTSPDALAARLIGAIGAPIAPLNGGRLGVSLGIYVGSVASVAEVLVFADKALYAAKGSGRNRACFFDETLRQRLDMRRDTERDLPAAIGRGEVQLWYQPIFSDGGRRMSGVEALLRWQHPKHGWIAPPDIVAAAALSGQADLLFRFIMGEACEMALRLDGMGHGDTIVSVNVSPREMSQLPVDEIVIEQIAAAGLPAKAIEIEVTEESALDLQAISPKLARLSASGIRIAIDDFGVGYSSLSSLRQLHADRIKIDRCFVTDLASSADNRMLLQAVISLGRAMNLDVVAEGVETAHDIVILRALGCQFMQGYHLARPMPAQTFLDTLARPIERAVAAGV